jgi:flagellar hook-associated protein 2
MATTAVSSKTSTTSPIAANKTAAATAAAANKAAAQKILTSLSAGSGVDTASLAQNLVDAEQLPQTNAINAKITKNDSKVSGISAVMFMMSELQTALTAVKDRDSFNTVTAVNSNTGALNVSASSAATAGSHTVSVSALSAPQRSISTGFASADSTLNGGSPFALTLTGTNTAGLSVGTPSTTATFQATIASPTFGTSASVTDFKNFAVTIDGKAYSLTPAPATATLKDLAANLQSQLRAMDGSSDLSVNVYGGTDLMISSFTTTRTITSPALSNAVVFDLDSGASEGTSGASTITDASFGTYPSTSDFSAFKVTIDGTPRSLVPGPAAPTMGALAANLQMQLRTLDDSTDISVTYSGSEIKVVSASGRAVAGISLKKTSYNDTPAGLAAAINASNRGFKAQLVNDGGSSLPYKLMITGATGSTEGFALSSTSSTPLSFATPAGYTASDALLNVDGISYQRKSNAITDIVPGLTLNLTAASSTPATVLIARDATDIKTKLTSLVTAYNDFNDIVNQTTDPKSTLDTYGATLVGDSTVRMVRQQMRALIFGTSSTPGTSIKTLGDLGYSIDQKGVLSLDSAKLDTVLNNNYADVVKLFTGGYNKLGVFSTAPAGIAGDAVKKLTSLLAKTGPLTTKSDNANTENAKYQARLDKLQVRMDALLARYQKQFASMDSLVGSVNSQKTSLKSTFDGMMAAYTNK